MATFEELHNERLKSKYRSAVFRYLVDHIDSNFRGSAGEKPKNVLLTDDKLAVPPEIFEEIAQELNGVDAQTKARVEAIMKATVTEGTPHV